MAKEITVTIDNGKLLVDLQGFAGKGCKEVLEQFAKLGSKVDEGTKPEFNKCQVNQVRK